MHIIQSIQAFARDEEGVTAIEYGLIAALVAIAIIGAATALGASLCATFNTVSVALGGEPGEC
jgi:pilus assembly protein Flp/PilA